jgi:hypothetical protein
VLKLSRIAGLRLLALSAAFAPAMAAKNEVDKLSPTVVRDLHFGDALFYYYQGQDFETITRLQAYRQWGRMPHHDAETDLLLGGLYLSLGLHNEAGERFETLLTQSVPEGVRNRAVVLSRQDLVRARLSRSRPSAPSRKCRGASRRISRPSACTCSATSSCASSVSMKPSRC